MVMLPKIDTEIARKAGSVSVSNQDYLGNRNGYIPTQSPLYDVGIITYRYGTRDRQKLSSYSQSEMTNRV